jgi:hypothetical protein
MSVGFKAFKTDTSQLIVDDTFTTWRVIQEGSVSLRPPTGSSSSFINLNRLYNCTTTALPLVFVQYPLAADGANYYLFQLGGYIASNRTPENIDQFFFNLTRDSHSSSLLIPYRLYTPLNYIDAPSVNTGWGMNIFDASGIPVFSTNYNPLILDNIFVVDSGLTEQTIQDPATGYVGNEVDTGLNGPWCSVEPSGESVLSVVVPIAANLRGVISVNLRSYYVNNTLRFRFYRSSQATQLNIPLQLPPQPTDGNTYKAIIYSFNRDRP